MQAENEEDKYFTDFSPRVFVTPVVDNIFQVGVEWWTGRTSTEAFLDGKKFELQVPAKVWDQTIRQIDTSTKTAQETAEMVRAAVEEIQQEYFKKQTSGC